MKVFVMIAFGICVFWIPPLSCQQEEKITPNTGITTFTLHEKERINGRTNGGSSPAFVLLSIESGNGSRLKEVRLNVSSFGSTIIYDNPGLPVGRYRLTQVVVHDASNKAIYATPHSGSELAKFVNNSLPIEFNINNNDTSVTAEVLAVLDEYKPELFGYESFPLELGAPAGKVKKVVFHDLFVDDAVTTMDFEYNNDEVEIVKWTFAVPSAGITQRYTEQRFYSSDGTLDSLSGGQFNGNAWSLSYEYIGGQVDRIKSYKPDSTHAITFLKYTGTKPALIENLYGIYGIYEGAKYPQYTTLMFDDNGDLVMQQNTHIPGHPAVTQEKTTSYSDEINPLRNLIKTPLPQAIDHFDDIAFHFSTHLPLSVEANYPYVYPVNNRITFEYTKDEEGRIKQIKAIRPDHNSLRYTLDITYY